MAVFNDLAIEIQEIIWSLVLPSRGVHYVQVEGISKPEEGLKQIQIEHASNPDYDENKARLFYSLYTAARSVWGACKAPDGADTAEEEALARRDRQLSSYTQINTLRSTCRLSRLVAQRYRADMDMARALSRGRGPLARPRSSPLTTSLRTCPSPREHGKNPRLVGTLQQQLDLPPQEPVIYLDFGTDLLVYRLYDAQGRPTATLRYNQQLMGDEPYLEWPPLVEWRYLGYPFAAVEWCREWETPEGRPHLFERHLADFFRLNAGKYFNTARCFIIDGVPRTQWDKLPRDIYTRLKYETSSLLETPFRSEFESKFPHLPYHMQLHDEFEGNGRRYYLVFTIDDSSNAAIRDPTPFPGGEHLWPEPLRAPMRILYNMKNNTPFDEENTMKGWGRILPIYLLSWEPI